MVPSILKNKSGKMISVIDEMESLCGHRIYKSVFASPFAANEYGRQQMPPIQSLMG
jgi:hypothetical protein